MVRLSRFSFISARPDPLSGRPAGSGILLSWRWSTVSVDAEPVLEQAGRAHDVGAEPGGGGVGGPLGVAPAVIPLTQGELPRSAVGRGQALDPHAEQTNPHARTGGLVERPGD